MSRYQKGKTNLDFTEARDSQWQWHQLGRMQIYTSLQTDNHASTPPLSFYRQQQQQQQQYMTKSLHALRVFWKYLSCNNNNKSNDDYVSRNERRCESFAGRALLLRQRQQTHSKMRRSHVIGHKCDVCLYDGTLLSSSQDCLPHTTTAGQTDLFTVVVPQWHN